MKVIVGQLTPKLQGNQCTCPHGKYPENILAWSFRKSLKVFNRWKCTKYETCADLNCFFLFCTFPTIETSSDNSAHFVFLIFLPKHVMIGAQKYNASLKLRAT